MDEIINMKENAAFHIPEIIVFKERAGCPGGGKEILIGENRCFTLATQMIDAVCFSIGSMNSEGMLSSNPNAGIRETDIARTIDANGSNPAGYQGGNVVCVTNSSGDGIATAIDASYYKGQGLRQGKEREFVLIV